MFAFKCDKCQHDKCDIETEEQYFLGEVDSIEVFAECTKCRYRERIN